jgi:hypothetical protein
MSGEEREWSEKGKAHGGEVEDTCQEMIGGIGKREM